jgi:hypothetical protein
MSRLEFALRHLAEGQFVDEVRYPEAFEVLSTPEGREKATQWIEAMGFRLCQLEEGGAFFMAYGYLDMEAKTKVKEEMRLLRARIQPAVMFLETVRQAQGRGAQLQPGDLLPLDVLMGAVRADVSLQQRLDDMREVPNSKAADPAADRLVHILNWLEREGFLVQTNTQHKVYQVTGKITYLYQLLQFMAEHVPQLAEEGVSDQLEQLPLTEQSGPAGTP